MSTPQIHAWQMSQPGEPLHLITCSAPELAPDEVLIRVVGCGVCHTDLGFFYGGVPVVQPLPITLGHEISGFVEKAGAKAQKWQGKAVLVPAVLPCGECELCKRGRGAICRKQKMPGNHVNGGFASHVIVPSRYLAAVEVENADQTYEDSGVTLKELSVVADAVTTPYQAIRKSGLQEGDFSIFVGVGGVGGFGVQLAKALGATVVAIDVDEAKLTRLKDFGADATFNPKTLDTKAIRKAVRGFASDRSCSPFEWKIFETSGTTAGQELAFGLLTFGATLGVVGYTPQSLKLRLSNLMAYDAQAIGNWGCDPEYYPEVLDLVRRGKVKIGPFADVMPMSRINDVFKKAHERKYQKRPILVPDFT